jgi:tRNA pseudouridine38-40 synthase
MPRYFIEVSYKGTNYKGFQVQQNANTIQAEVEKALLTVQKDKLDLTGSSRTDSGVHALQNYFHFDYGGKLKTTLLYNLNSVLPPDISVKRILQVSEESHCRFDALSREYKYFISPEKNPFLQQTAYYFPYAIDEDKLQTAAGIIKQYDDFTSFSKKNTQVKTFICRVEESKWLRENECLVYYIRANRFLRGMVRALVATMLKAGRNNLTIEEFRGILESKKISSARFAAPAHGLFLAAVNFPEKYFDV